MRNRRAYNYTDIEGKEWQLYVGLVLVADNGHEWKIEKIGPHRVKYSNVTEPEDTYRYTAHWHFIENVIKWKHWKNAK